LRVGKLSLQLSPGSQPYTSEHSSSVLKYTHPVPHTPGIADPRIPLQVLPLAGLPDSAYVHSLTIPPQSLPPPPSFKSQRRLTGTIVIILITATIYPPPRCTSSRPASLIQQTHTESLIQIVMMIVFIVCIVLCVCDCLIVRYVWVVTIKIVIRNYMIVMIVRAGWDTPGITDAEDTMDVGIVRDWVYIMIVRDSACLGLDIGIIWDIAPGPAIIHVPPTTPVANVSVVSGAAVIVGCRECTVPHHTFSTVGITGTARLALTHGIDRIDDIIYIHGIIDPCVICRIINTFIECINTFIECMIVGVWPFILHMLYVRAIWAILLIPPTHHPHSTTPTKTINPPKKAATPTSRTYRKSGSIGTSGRIVKIGLSRFTLQTPTIGTFLVTVNTVTFGNMPAGEG